MANENINTSKQQLTTEEKLSLQRVAEGISDLIELQAGLKGIGYAIQDDSRFPHNYERLGSAVTALASHLRARANAIEADLISALRHLGVSEEQWDACNTKRPLLDG